MMWPRKLLDISWMDFAYAGCKCLTGGTQRNQRHKKKDYCFDANHTLICLSVRSGFDLFLQTLNLPAGSEVLMTAITIPGMIEIVRRHNLIPVPVDLSVSTLAPNEDEFEKSITPATRLIVIAHLFGSRHSLAQIRTIADRHRLILVEDCAQSFDNVHCLGKSVADVSLYSFGPIKTATALGGAVVWARNEVQLDQMRLVQKSYPVQTISGYIQRLAKYALLKVLSQRFLFGWIFWTCLNCRRDPDHFLTTFARNFGRQDLFESIRRKPCKALEAMVVRVCVNDHRATRIARRTVLGHKLKNLLRGRVIIPGDDADYHSFWVFPIIIDEPESIIAPLRRAGFDATCSHNLTVFTDEGKPLGQRAPVMAAMMQKTVFLPLYPEMPDREVERMARVVQQHLERRVSKLSSEPTTKSRRLHHSAQSI